MVCKTNNHRKFRRKIYRPATHDIGNGFDQLPLLDIIRIGRRVTAENLAEHHSFFENKLVGLSTRLPEIYSGYRLIAFEVTCNGFTH